MKNIDAFDRPEGRHTEDRTRGYWACYHACQEAERQNYDAPIFKDVVWDETIADIVKELRAAKIERFVITVAQSGIADTIDQFERAGCYLAGICKVPTQFTQWDAHSMSDIQRFDNGFSLLVSPAPDPRFVPITQRVEVMLTDHEISRLTEIAIDRDTTPAGILAAFASDLTYGERTGGSDERMYAEDWLGRRCDWGC
ncbi:DUF7698 family protein [Intestinimonas butyriciproducens]|uniref:DUF7698 family protein n=1 Tax=Intestinimonas butyriciproducens TaxID=1297617 RepID=UPI00189CFC23|nr:hypothetical protein [Intestinimonas butyriciproducens]